MFNNKIYEYYWNQQSLQNMINNRIKIQDNNLTFVCKNRITIYFSIIYNYFPIATLHPNTMMSQIRKYSKQVSSNFADDPRGVTQQISKSVLDKYLHEDTPCLDALERLLYRIIPYWHISLPRMMKNVSAVIGADWEFDYITDGPRPVLPDKQLTTSMVEEINDQSLAGKNISIYLVFWLPLTTMLLAHILHNQPNQQNKFGVAGTAVVMVGFMVIISYAMYVYANVIGSPFNMFLQHFCPTTYIAILDCLYAIICAASPTIVLIPMTIVYACATTGLHFRLYNQAFKPTLFEMVALFCLIAVLHISAAYFYYLNFSWFWTHKDAEPLQKEGDLTRHFSDSNTL